MGSILEIGVYRNKDNEAHGVKPINDPCGLLGEDIEFCEQEFITGIPSIRYLVGENIGLRLFRKRVRNCTIRPYTNKDYYDNNIEEDGLEEIARGIRSVCGEDFNIKVNKENYVFE